jgi:hypothetical protein
MQGVPGSLVGVGAPTMQPVTRLLGFGDSSVGTVLGADHPLARALDELAAARRQLVAVGALLVVCVGVTVAGLVAALPLALAAGGVGVVLAVRAAVVADRRRQCVLDLIIAGGAHLPLDDVQRVRGQLLEPRRRRQLAGCLDTIARASELATGTPADLQLTHRRTVEPVRRELREIAAIVHGDEPNVAGLAMAERLVHDGCSPLYGTDPVALRETLWRIRFRLHA